MRERYLLFVFFLCLTPGFLMAQFYEGPRFYMLGGKRYNPALLGAGQTGTRLIIQNGFYFQGRHSAHFYGMDHTLKGGVSTLGMQAYFERVWGLYSYNLAFSYTHAFRLNDRWRLRSGIQSRVVSYFPGQVDWLVHGQPTFSSGPQSYFGGRFDLGLSLHHRFFYFAFGANNFLREPFDLGRLRWADHPFGLVGETGGKIPLKARLTKSWPLSVHPYIRYNSADFEYFNIGFYALGGPLLAGVDMGAGVVGFSAGYRGERFRFVYTYLNHRWFSGVNSYVSPTGSHELGLQFLIPRKEQKAPDFYSGF